MQSSAWRKTFLSSKTNSFFLFSFFFLIFFYELFSHFDSSKYTRDAINHSKSNDCIDDKQKRDQHENKKSKKHHHPKNYVFLGKETS